MAKISALVFLTALGRGHAGACAPSCKKLSDGLYCPVSDVTDDANIILDIAFIDLLLKRTPPDYDTAKDVYMQGEESKMLTLQGLALKDMTAGGRYKNAFYEGAVKLYGSVSKLWNDPIMACLDKTGSCKEAPDSARTFIINKGLTGVATFYMTFYMGEAIWKAAQGQFDDSTGAPHAWDGAAAIYIGNIRPSSGDGVTGNAPGNLFSPYEFHWALDTDFPAGTNTHAASIAILNYGLKASRKATYSDAKIKEAELAMQKIIAIAAFRSAIKFAGKASRPGTSEADAGWARAEGLLGWHTAAGLLEGLDGEAVKKVDALLDPSKEKREADEDCKVKTVVESLYQKAGITCDMVGSWKDGTGCTTGTCGTTGGKLLGGDTAYMDTCRAASSEASGTEASGAAAVGAAFGGALLAGLPALVHMA